ncbi:Dihydroorotate dehydrogenase (quinone), mitochondrial, partial [Varicellaria rhodocarpa]|nr:Dihydroorotate dehydrogenase (quinone), mitochondrial [Varicellaria rhodocarpa]
LIARPASTSSVLSETRSFGTRTTNLVLGTVIGLSLVFGYYYLTDTRAGIHQWVAVPSLRWIYDDAEDAHVAGIKALKGLYKFGIHPRERGDPDQAGDLEIKILGHTLRNPIGTSAGIDKHAEIPTALLALGPSIIEIGGITPQAQYGNPKPRVFRLPSQNGLINRYGLNSEGADDMAMRLRQRVREYAFSMGYGIDEIGEQRVLNGEAGVPPGSLVKGKLMAVQVAKNQSTPDDDIEAVKQDYVYCVEKLAKYADIVVVNVSSPNTPGLRGLQKVEPLTNILKGVVSAAQRTDRKSKPAVMCKVSPDEDSEEQVMGICTALMESGVDGVIVGNTTTKRGLDLLPAGSSLSSREANVLLEEQGGYSGPQLFQRTVNLVKRYRSLLDESSNMSVEQGLAASSLSANSRTSSASTKPPSESTASQATLTDRIEATVRRDMANLKESTKEAESDSKSQPLIRLPARNNPFASDTATSEDTPPLSLSTHVDQLPPVEDKPVAESSALARKVIFASGGITTGHEALEVLNAGADLAMVYTVLVVSNAVTSKLSRYLLTGTLTSMAESEQLVASKAR